MSIRRRTQFIINFKGGSEFQQMSMRECLKAMVTAWKIFYESKHKKNVINFEEKEWKE